METFFFLALSAVAIYVYFNRNRDGHGGESSTESMTSDSIGTFSIEVSTSMGRGYGQSGKLTSMDQAQKGDRLWVPAGDNVEIKGRTVSGGMFYCGKALASLNGWDDGDPALISPSMKVAWDKPDRAGDAMDYWPSYARIPTGCRAAYLDWLSTGRSDPDAGIGYVFLFFYGLERRILVDLRHLPEKRAELPGLILELESLLSIYGSNRSFRGYATSLLFAARALAGDASVGNQSQRIERSYGYLPAWVLVSLGRTVSAGNPIPSDLALAWLVGHPETRLRTPAKRCPEEFRELFFRRYVDKFGSGMHVKPNKTRLRLTHHPASASFGGDVEIPIDDLPDVSVLSNPLRSLREIAESVQTDLEGFSRLVGRRPEKAGSLEGLALLPAELASTRQGAEVNGLKEWIERCLLENELAVVTVAEVVKHWDCSEAGKISKKELGSFAKLLASVGYAMEPDPRFGGGALATTQKAVLFRPGPDPIAAATPNYRSAMLLLHLAAVVAAADGDVSESEEKHLEGHLERSHHLSEGEARRLRAHLRWLLAERPSLAGLKNRLQGVGSRHKQGIASFAIATAGADGVIDSAEVSTIMKIYKLLGLDPEQAYGDIHSLQADSQWNPADAPVTVRPPDTANDGFSIPAGPSAELKPDGRGVRLDMERVARTLADSATVSQILGEIFSDEASEVGLPAARVDSSEPSGSLAPAHVELLRLLRGRERVSREEFEHMADALGLLVDGAYEMLNEAAFDMAGAPLLEGDNPIEVDLEILGELLL